VKGTVKETTYANYSYITWRHIAPALGRVKLKSLTPAHVRSFYGEKARTNLSAATVKKMHVELRRALSQSVSDGLIPRNAADGVKPPRVNAPGAEIRPLNSDECRTFLEASRGERLEAVYVLAVHCGLREGELLALRWEDVDLEAAKPALHVRHTLTRGEDGRGHVIGASTKSGKGRRVRLTRRAVAALKDHRKASSKRGCAWPGSDTMRTSCSLARPAPSSIPQTCATAPSSASRSAPVYGKTCGSTICGTPALRCS
jgi:integrase